MICNGRGRLNLRSMFLQHVWYYTRCMYLDSHHSVLNFVEVDGVLVSGYRLTMRLSGIHIATNFFLLVIVTVNLHLLIVEYLVLADARQLLRRFNDLREVRRYGSFRNKEFTALA